MTEKSPFEILNDTITVLVVDDDPHQLDFYEDILSGHPLLTVVRAGTTRQAEEVIRTTTPHLCFLDMGIDDVNEDEFYLLKKFSQRLPFIVVSGSMDIERAFAATKSGAAAMVAKPPDITTTEFWNIIAMVFIDRCIIPHVPATANQVLRECCRILAQDLPENVSDWAGKAGITDTYLRKLWSESGEGSPKQLLFLYKLYKDAFSWCNGWYLAQINDTVFSSPKIDPQDLTQRISYYILNKLALSTIRDKPVTDAVNRLPVTPG